MENELTLADRQNGGALPVPHQERQGQLAMSPQDRMLSDAISTGNMEIIERMLAVKERIEAAEALRAYTAAKAAFAAEGITVIRDKFNRQYGSQYSSLGNLVATAGPYLGKHSLAADWKIKQESGSITVTCILTHAMGHKEEVSFTVPPDTGGAKNAIQAIKSAVTYAKSATYESVCGIASTDANYDDDGHDGGAKAPAAQTLPALGKNGFDKACTSIERGEWTVDDIKRSYNLTDEQETKLRAIKRLIGEN